MDGIVSIRYMHEDKMGNFYIQTERINNEQLFLEIHKFNQSGEGLATILIPENEYQVWTQKLVSIDNVHYRTLFLYFESHRYF